MAVEQRVKTYVLNLHISHFKRFLVSSGRVVAKMYLNHHCESICEHLERGLNMILPYQLGKV